MSSYDILIQNTTIVDGTGLRAITGSVGISGERIISVGDIDPASMNVARVIDGTGLITCRRSQSGRGGAQGNLAARRDAGHP